uniref:Reverse transcriptase domain-containing protein n=1 Tax=Tanacetum cinerariifolium TaxID=118510 RepID=A0A699J3C9_TANCI|nr:reverse transcriptase domain-containing protein [Tanacetum cinerariifolium]
MRTRRSYFPPTATIPLRSKKQTTNVVEPEFRTIVEMANNRTMAQMLQAPIKGYEDAVVVPHINANNFELKQTLINFVQSNQFTGRQDPHNHLRFFNKVTSTFRHPEVPKTTIKLLLFPFSLEGEARIWIDKEPPILTWEDLASKFINQFFPPSKTTYLRNEITNFLQKPNETFNEAWARFKDLLRQCPYHGFYELHQLDTFYNALNQNDQDALDSAARGNFLDKIPRECLSIIESKAKVEYSRSRITDSRENTNAPLSSSLPSHSFDLQQIAASLEDKLDIRMNRFKKSLNDMKISFITPTAPIKAVEKITSFFTGAANDQPIAEASQHPEWFQKQTKPLTLDRAWNKTLPATHGIIQPWISDLAKQADSRTSFNELMDTPVDFSAFLMNQLKVDTLTSELLAGPTYELMKGSCKSLVDLEFFLEEVYKATTDQLDWNNPKGQQYLHNLLKPLPLIPNSRGRHVIPFDHFINNDLEYLRGGTSSRKYTTSVTKTKAADYGHIKWIEDLIVEWHNYKHLDWITMRRDDDKLYRFKEGDIKRLRIQDIEDMLLLLV